MKPDDPLLNIKFVQEVKKNELLWNYIGPGPLKRQVQDKVWQEVAKKFNEPASALRERWRNIRTAFFASEKLKHTRLGHKPKKSYYLSTHLQFLWTVKNNMQYENDSNQNSIIDIESNENTLDLSENEDIIENIEKNITNNDHIEEESILKDIKYEFNPEVLNFDNRSCSSYVKKQSRKRKHKNPEIDVAIVDLIKTLKTNNDDSKDSNVLFLHSLLPDISKLTDQQNRSFRIKVLTLLDDLLIKNGS